MPIKCVYLTHVGSEVHVAVHVLLEAGFPVARVLAHLTLKLLLLLIQLHLVLGIQVT